MKQIVGKCRKCLCVTKVFSVHSGDVVILPEEDTTFRSFFLSHAYCPSQVRICLKCFSFLCGVDFIYKLVAILMHGNRYRHSSIQLKR